MNSESTTNVPACADHCEHDPKFLRDGYCTALERMGHCGHQCQPIRICQRGVDGSASCGHEERFFLVAVGHCGYFPTRDGYAGNICGHRCDFAPSPPEAEVEKTHEFVPPPFDAEDNLCRARVASGWSPPYAQFRVCYQPTDAPVHKVESEPQTQCGDCGERDLHDPSCHYSGSVKGVQRVFTDAPIEPPPVTVEPPARVWIRPEDAEYSTTPLNYDGDDIEYVRLAPIRAALEACEASGFRGYDSDWGDFYQVRKSDWEALVNAIKGA